MRCVIRCRAKIVYKFVFLCYLLSRLLVIKTIDITHIELCSLSFTDVMRACFAKAWRNASTFVKVEVMQIVKRSIW